MSVPSRKTRTMAAVCLAVRVSVIDGVWEVSSLPTICEDPHLFILIRLNNRCEQLLTEFCGKNTVDLRLDHSASLIDLDDGVIFDESFAYHVGLYFFSGFFNEFGIGVDGLAKDVIAFDLEFCGEVFKFLFSNFFGAQLARFLHGWVLIVFSDGIDDKTATIFHFCGMA